MGSSDPGILRSGVRETPAPSRFEDPRIRPRNMGPPSGKESPEANPTAPLANSFFERTTFFCKRTSKNEKHDEGIVFEARQDAAPKDGKIHRASTLFENLKNHVWQKKTAKNGIAEHRQIQGPRRRPGRQFQESGIADEFPKKQPKN